MPKWVKPSWDWTETEEEECAVSAETKWNVSSFRLLNKKIAWHSRPRMRLNYEWKQISRMTAHQKHFHHLLRVAPLPQLRATVSGRAETSIDKKIFFYRKPFQRQQRITSNSPDCMSYTFVHLFVYAMRAIIELYVQLKRQIYLRTVKWIQSQFPHYVLVL